MRRNCLRRTADSTSVKAAVGSSRMSTRADLCSAAANTIRRRSEGVRVALRARGSTRRPNTLERFARPLHRRPLVVEAESARQMTGEHVLGDRQVRHDVQLLRNQHDSGGLTRSHRREVLRFALQFDRAFERARGDDARQDLHQGRLAGTVLADNRQHLARPHGHIDAVQDRRPPVSLGERRPRRRAESRLRGACRYPRKRRYYSQALLPAPKTSSLDTHPAGAIWVMNSQRLSLVMLTNSMYLVGDRSR